MLGPVWSIIYNKSIEAKAVEPIPNPKAVKIPGRGGMLLGKPVVNKAMNKHAIAAHINIIQAPIVAGVSGALLAIIVVTA